MREMRRCHAVAAQKSHAQESLLHKAPVLARRDGVYSSPPPTALPREQRVAHLGPPVAVRSVQTWERHCTVTYSAYTGKIFLLAISVVCYQPSTNLGPDKGLLFTWVQVLCVKVLPRLTWVAFFIILMVWICQYGAGLKAWSHMNPVPLLSYHYFFMGLAWPVCMTEAILSYRAPLIPFRQRRCGRPQPPSFKKVEGKWHKLKSVWYALWLV